MAQEIPPVIHKLDLCKSAAIWMPERNRWAFTRENADLDGKPGPNELTTAMRLVEEATDR